MQHAIILTRRRFCWHLLLPSLAVLVLFLLASWPSQKYSPKLNSIQNSLVNRHPVKDVAEEVKQRTSHAMEACWSYYRYRKQTFFSRLVHQSQYMQVHPVNRFVNHKYKFLVCLNAKAGNTNLRRYFIRMSESLNASYSYQNDDIDTLHQSGAYTSKDLLPIDRLTNQEFVTAMSPIYRKAVFVRDPLRRLVSAWRNKLLRPIGFNESTKDYRLGLGNKVLKVAQSPGWQERIENGTSIPVTLREFFQYLANAPASEIFDQHWLPYFQNCFPCEMNYDFIGHLESVEREIEYFARNVTQSSKVPEMAMPPDRSLTFEQDIASVPKELIWRAISKHYLMDYHIFGYNLSSVYWL